MAHLIDARKMHSTKSVNRGMSPWCKHCCNWEPMCTYNARIIVNEGRWHCMLPATIVAASK